MVLKIKSSDTPEKIKKELQAIEDGQTKKHIARLKPLFGTLKLREDPVKLQRRWRDEW